MLKISDHSNSVIFGCEGTEVTAEESRFFKNTNPLGFILFRRNIETPEQVKKLTSDLKEVVGWECPILIDQEGGRVARLTPPNWRKSPAMSLFANIAERNKEGAELSCKLNAIIIGNELKELGINIDCAPVADLLFKETHAIIGDRSFGNNPEIVAALARKMAEGLMDAGVLPVIKHIPGHGRALVDSHEDLPIVTADKKTLQENDFRVFTLLNDLPIAMTAHIVYTAIDKELPATLSPAVIELVRKEIGFSGIILTDDLSMKALKGTFKERTEQALKAGCDIVLHCNGNMDEMQEIAEHITPANDVIKIMLESAQNEALIKNLDINTITTRYNEITNQFSA